MTLTILFYLNGNNDLLPEISQSLTKLEQTAFHPQTHVVAQVGLGDQDLVSILRPEEPYRPSLHHWSGVKRFQLQKHGLEPIADMGKINMADPKTLSNYLTWATSTFPADQTVLVLGGHGIQHIGALLDFSQERPYIMGLPEMCKAIKEFKGPKIDLLILDICYMNTLELLYELSCPKHQYTPLVTYIGTGPLSGLPYDRVISILQENAFTGHAHQWVQKITEQLHFDLVSFNLHPHLLDKIKTRFNNQATCYLERLTDTNTPLPPPQARIKGLLATIEQQMKQDLSSLISHYKRVHNHHDPLLELLNFDPRKIPLGESYFKFAFTRSSHWTDLIIQKDFRSRLALLKRVGSKSLPLSADDLFEYLAAVNPNWSREKVKRTFHELCFHNQWLIWRSSH